MSWPPPASCLQVCTAASGVGRRSKKQGLGAASEYGDRQAGRRQREEARRGRAHSRAGRRGWTNVVQRAEVVVSGTTSTPE